MKDLLLILAWPFIVLGIVAGFIWFALSAGFVGVQKDITKVIRS